MDKIDFYNDGKCFVELIDFMGSDYRVLESARQSTTGIAQKGDKEDRGLIRYLYKNQHMSPFEQCFFTFKFKIPLFVSTQLNRHRTMSFNYYSQRYSEAPEEFFIPEVMRVQGEKNHQGSGEEMNGQENDDCLRAYNDCNANSLWTYNKLIEAGVSRELARCVLPEAVYTTGMLSVNLRNLFHFLELRLHEHAQKEIRDFAQAIYDLIKQLPEFKWAIEAFEDFTLKGIKLTKQEVEELRELIKIANYCSVEDFENMKSQGKDKTICEKIGV